MTEYMKIERGSSNTSDKVANVRQFKNSNEFKSHYQKAIRFQNDPKKSATEADLYRIEGNQCYTQHKFIPALEYYNKSNWPKVTRIDRQFIKR